MRQPGPLFGVSHSAAHRVVDSLETLLALARYADGAYRGTPK